MAVGPLTCWRRTRAPARGRRLGLAPSTKVAAGQDLELVGRPAVAGQPAFHVPVERCPASSVPCREKMQSEAAAANSRPASESPAWKITG